MSYQVYASDTDPPPDSRSVGETITHVPPAPAGIVHAVHAGHEQTMCGLPIDGCTCSRCTCGTRSAPTTALSAVHGGDRGEGQLTEPTSPDRPRRRRRRLRRPHINAESRFEDRVKPLELFFDLVFVLAFTQCTALMAHLPTWEGVAQAMLVLGVLWWAWVGYAWLTSVIDPEEGSVRIVMFGATAGLLVAGLCAPEAFGDRALAFAVAYGLVRVAHIVLFLIAARDDPDLRRSVVGLAISTALGVGLLLGASFADGGVQYAIWIAAIVADFGGPALFGADGWSLVPAHFAERHGLIIILALGESVVALGAGADVSLGAEVYVAAVLGVGIAAALWWIYFDVVALVTAERLEQAPAGPHAQPVRRATPTPICTSRWSRASCSSPSDSRSRSRTSTTTCTWSRRSRCSVESRSTCSRTSCCASATRARSPSTRLGVAVLLFALWPLATEMTALTSLIVMNVVLWLMIAYENAHYDERRYRLRHGLDPSG